MATLYRRDKRFSAYKRLLHWMTALAFLGCAVTGMYIGHPTWWIGSKGVKPDAFVMGYIRLTHYICAIILDIILFQWLYLFFFGRDPWYKSVFPIRKSLKEYFMFLKNMFTLSEKDKPRVTERMDAMNGWGLMVFVILVKAFLLFTGFGMLMNQLNFSNSLFGHVSAWFLGLIALPAKWVLKEQVLIRKIHHILAWIAITTVSIHIYIQIWRSVFWKEGDVEIVIGGYKFIKEKEK